MNRLHNILKRRWGTLRNFRQGKRKELRAVRTAANELFYGCAFLPRSAYNRVCRIRRELDQLKTELSVKEWGR